GPESTRKDQGARKGLDAADDTSGMDDFSSRILAEPPSHLDRIAHSVIGAAIEVHRRLGPGFLEAVYEEAMLVELGLRGLAVTQQVWIPIFYKEIRIAEARIDLLVGVEPVVQIKSLRT